MLPRPSLQRSLSSEDQLRGIIEKLQEMALTRTDVAYLRTSADSYQVVLLNGLDGPWDKGGRYVFREYAILLPQIGYTDDAVAVL